MKKNISKRMIGNKNPCKKVINYETKEIFNSIKEASDVLNISQSYLSQQLNGKRRNKTKLMYL